jgi:hypothetical protein
MIIISVSRNGLARHVMWVHMGNNETSLCVLATPQHVSVWMNNFTMDKAEPPSAKIGLHPVTSLQLSVGLNSVTGVSVCLSRSVGVCP